MAGFSLRSLGRGLGRALLESGKAWWRRNHGRSAAALAFFSLFSMVPILMITTGLASMLIGGEQARLEVRQTAELFFDQGASGYLEELLKEQPTPTFTGVSSVLSFFVLLFAASKVVAEMRNVLNEIFGVRPREGRRATIIALVLGRLVPILLVVSLGGVMAVSAMADAVLRPAALYLDGYVPLNLRLWEIMQRILSVGLMVLLFALIIRWLPASPPPFKEAAVGGVLAAVLIVILKSLIGIYFEQSSVITAYGAAVTLVVILLWIYFTIQIFFLGAELTAYLGRLRRGEVDNPPRIDAS